MASGSTSSTLRITNTNGTITGVPSGIAAQTEVGVALRECIALDHAATATVGTGTITSVQTFNITQTMYVTSISILPLTLSATLTFAILYGGYHIATPQNPISITSASFRRDFTGNNLPVLYAGDTITIFAYSTVSQSITIEVSGFAL